LCQLVELGIGKSRARLLRIWIDEVDIDLET
jgi:hypothetical protein